jgi:hypothetical protein
MDTKEYIDQLKAYVAQFVDWWCKPYEKFFKEYDKQNRSLFSRLIPIRINTSESVTKFNYATIQFEKDIRQKRDLVDEIFTFLNDNYEVYLRAVDSQRDEIRTLIGNTFYQSTDADMSHYMGNYMQTLLLEYVTEHVLAQLKTMGDEVWLTRGLVAISIENCCEDDRETISCFAKLYVAAKRIGINPEPAFQRVAEISSKKTPKGGESSLSGMLTAISEYAATNYGGLFL